MSIDLQSARCFQHVSREAAARCPSCSRFFCRECVTEHEGRVMCRGCLEELLNPPVEPRAIWVRSLLEMALALAGFAFATFAFYMIGRILLRIPSQFHSGIFFE